MPGGIHITEADCAEMRRKYHDQGLFAALIAQEFDVSRQCVDYHVQGRCEHTHDR